MNAVVAVILGEEELEVGLVVLDASDLIFFIDEISRSVSRVVGFGRRRAHPRPLRVVG